MFSPFWQGLGFLPGDFALPGSDHRLGGAFGAAGADVVQVDGEALAALAEYASHPLTPAEEAGDKDERPVNASVLTMLVVACASLGVSILWLATTSALRLEVIRPSWGAEGDRGFSAGTHDGLSFLGVFVL